MVFQKIENWLKNVDRKYTDGLTFFEDFASAQMKVTYGEYLRKKEGNEMDSAFSMLINKLTAIHNNMRAFPDKFPEAFVGSTPRGNVFAMTNQVSALLQTKEDLEAEVETLKESEDDKSIEIDELNEQIEEKNEQIEELTEQLTKSGVRILKFEDLSKAMQKKHTRIRDITPLMAKIHSDMANESLTDEERKALAEELCLLDDERVAFWNEVDENAHGKGEAILENKHQLSANPLVRGMQIAKRISRLRENVRRTGEAVEKHKSAGKENYMVKAQEQHDAYKQDLEALEAQVKEDETK